jgi:hypothetical protein
VAQPFLAVAVIVETEKPARPGMAVPRESNWQHLHATEYNRRAHKKFHVTNMATAERQLVKNVDTENYSGDAPSGLTRREKTVALRRGDKRENRAK